MVFKVELLSIAIALCKNTYLLRFLCLVFVYSAIAHFGENKSFSLSKLYNLHLASAEKMNEKITDAIHYY